MKRLTSSKKQILAIICVLSMLAGSVLPQAGTIAKASDSALKFGDTGAYLELEDSLTQMPDTIETTVTMDKEWTIVSADGSMAGLTAKTELTEVPDGSRNYAGKTVDADKAFEFYTTFDVTIPDVYGMEDLALDFWLYNPNDSIEKSTGNDNQLELSSSGTCDKQEIWWRFNSNHMTFKQGWNHIYLPLDSHMYYTTGDQGYFDLTAINYIRLYGVKNTGAKTDYIISDIKLVLHEEETEQEWDLASKAAMSELVYASKALPYVTTKVDEENGGPKSGTSTFELETLVLGDMLDSSIDLTAYGAGRVAVSFWVYSCSDNPWGRLEITSTNARDDGELYYKFEDIGIKGGQWNYFELPLASALVQRNNGTNIDLANINFFNIEISQGRVDGTFRISEVKLIVPDEILYPAYGTTNTTDITVYSGTDENAGAVPTKDREFYTISNGLNGKVWKESSGSVKNGTVTNSTPCSMNFTGYDRDDVALSFWYYTSGTAFNGGRIELTSAATISSSSENARVAVDLTKLDATAGWHYVEYPLDNSNIKSGSSPIVDKDATTTDSIVFTMSNIDYFRTYFSTPSTGTFIISDITIKLLKGAKESNTLGAVGSVLQPYSKDCISTYIGKETTSADGNIGVGVPYASFTFSSGTSVVRLKNLTSTVDVKNYTQDNLALAFWVKTGSTGAWMPTDSGRISLSSSQTDDKQEYYYDIKKEITKFNLVSEGWNYIEIPLRDFIAHTGDNATRSEDYDYTKLNRIRLIFWKGANYSDVTWNITDFKIVAMNEIEESEDTGDFTIFSNVNGTQDTGSYSLTVTKNGYPTLIYGTTAYSLKEDIRTGEAVTVKATTDTSGNLSFYKGDTLLATRGMNATATVNTDKKYTIAANPAGEQQMYGCIRAINISNNGTSLGSWSIGDISNTSQDIVDTSGTGNTAVWYNTDTYTTTLYTKEQITTLQNADVKYPTKTGYVFAGWYSAPTCATTEAYRTIGNIPTEGAYAKFVDDKILTIKAQVKYTVDSNDDGIFDAVGDTTDIRFVTTVDSLAYRYIGFTIQINNGTEHEYEQEDERTYNVYNKLYYISDDSKTMSVTPSEVCAPKSVHFKACTLIDFVKATDYDVNVTVTPYWITLDGTRVTGMSATKSVNDFINN